MKTGYQIWHLNHLGGVDNQQSDGWGKIWRHCIPHKIKVFLWRLCRNNVHVRNLLRNKGVHVPISCVMYVSDVEHLLHLFFDCVFAEAYWQRMEPSYNMWEVESASAWLHDKLITETGDNLIKIANVLWRIW